MYGSNYTYGGNNIINQIFSLIKGAIGSYIIIFLVFYILSVISRWIILTKANEKGWKSLIPIYSTYIEYKLFWNKYIFFLQILLFVAGMSLAYFGSQNSKSLLVTIGILMVVAIAVLRYIQFYKKAKFFSQGLPFAVGLYFMPFIFNLVLAFDKDCKHGYRW